MNSVSNTSITANTSTCRSTSSSAETISFDNNTINCTGDITIGNDTQTVVNKPDYKCIQANTTKESFTSDVGSKFKSAIKQAASGVNLTPSIQTQKQIEETSNSISNMFQNTEYQSCSHDVGNTQHNSTDNNPIGSPGKPCRNFTAGGIKQHLENSGTSDCIQKNKTINSSMTKLQNSLDEDAKQQSKGISGAALVMMILGILAICLVAGWFFTKYQKSQAEAPLQMAQAANSFAEA
jgi:hypothetical protein